MALDDYLRISEAIPGWTRGAEARELAALSFSLRSDPLIVEIGSFLGSGTVLLAGPRRDRGSGIVHCIDSFDGQGDTFSVPYYREILAQLPSGSVRGHFEHNLSKWGLSSWVRIHEGRADEIASNWTTAIDYPIASETYDIVLAANVLEHVPKIWTWIRKVARIIRPGGIAIVIAPCSWPYHAVPQDCWRVYPDGIRALMEEGGLSVEIAEWGTLEFPEISCALPGRSFEHQPESYREQAMPLVGQGAFPMEKSFDTICVARKF